MALYECNNNRKSIKCQPVIMVADNYNDKQLYWIQSVLNNKLKTEGVARKGPL